MSHPATPSSIRRAWGAASLALVSLWACAPPSEPHVAPETAAGPTTGPTTEDLAPTTDQPASRVPIGAGAPWPSVSRVGCTHIWGVADPQIGAGLADIVIDAVEVSFEFDPARHGDVQVLIKTPEGIWADVPGQTSPASGANSGRLAWKGTATEFAVGTAAQHGAPYPHGTWHVSLADNDDCTDLTGVGLRLIGSGVPTQ